MLRGKDMTENIIWAVIVIAGAMLIMAAGAALCRRFRRNLKKHALDNMEGLEFEYYCAEYLEGE